ncbi:MAG: hypothetical protein LCH43_13560 [Actinobacteria bacterium]|nr:hypothetical protein [Actinomycetota bacterium]
MATKKEESAPAASASIPSEPVLAQSDPAQPPVTRRRGLGGGAIAGIVVGSFVVAGALFGGGVLVGSHLPSGMTQSQVGPGFGPGDGDNDGRPPFPGGGHGPVQPGQNDGDTDSN